MATLQHRQISSFLGHCPRLLESTTTTNISSTRRLPLLKVQHQHAKQLNCCLPRNPGYPARQTMKRARCPSRSRRPRLVHNMNAALPETRPASSLHGTMGSVHSVRRTQGFRRRRTMKNLLAPLALSQCHFRWAPQRYELTTKVRTQV